MSAASKTILAVALVVVAVVVVLVAGEFTGGYLWAARPTVTGGSGGAAFGQYLTILILVDVGLGTVVAWMLFGKRV